MRGESLQLKRKINPAETMRRVAEASEGVKRINDVHQNTDGNEK